MVPPLLIRQFHLDSGHGHITNAALTVTAFGLVETVAERSPGHRRPAPARMDQLRMATPTRNVRRHREPRIDVHDCARPRERLVPRPARMDRRSGVVRRRTRRVRPTAHHLSRRSHANRRHRRNVAVRTQQYLANDFYDGQHTDTALPGADVVSKGSVTPAATAPTGSCSTATRSRVRQPRVRRVGVLAPAPHLGITVRAHPHRLRREPRPDGFASESAGRPATSSSSATPKSSSTASSAPGHYAAPPPPTGSSSTAPSSISSRL